MSRLEQAQQENLRIDGLTHQFYEPIPFRVESGADLVRLRSEWLKRDSIPCHVPAREAGLDHSWPGMDVRTLLTGDNSSGRISAHDIIVPPGGAVAPHWLETGDAFIFVMNGKIEITVGRTRETARRESFAYVPARTTTAWRNNSNAPARLYVLYSPAGVDRAFAEAHELWVRSCDAAAEAYQTVLARYGFRFDLAGLLENDTRTNSKPQRMDYAINSFEDFQAMREAWSRRTPTPKLMHDATTCNKVQLPDGIDSSVLVSGDECSGRGVLFFGCGQPGYVAGPHYQPSEEELFFIVEGEMELTCGANRILVKEGGFGFAPRGATHAFTVTGRRPARFLTFNSPAGHERSFEMIMEEVRKMEPGAPLSPRFIERISHHGSQLHNSDMLEPLREAASGV